MPDSPAPAGRDKRQLRRIAHHLNPVVTVADNGLSESLYHETDRALSDHELIKVRITTDDRDDRKALGGELAEAVNAHIVQVIGKTFVLYRMNPEADPKLSNVARFGA
jgi:RNA-binding protein